MSLIRIGKVGGRPFSSRETAEEFVEKYGMSGTVVEQSPFGFAIEVERDSFHQIDSRKITETPSVESSIHSKSSHNSYAQKNATLIAPIEDMLNACLSNQDKLDSNTFGWIQKLAAENQNNKLELQRSTINRLNSAYKRVK